MFCEFARLLLLVANFFGSCMLWCGGTLLFIWYHYFAALAKYSSALFSWLSYFYYPTPNMGSDLVDISGLFAAPLESLSPGLCCNPDCFYAPVSVNLFPGLELNHSNC